MDEIEIMLNDPLFMIHKHTEQIKRFTDEININSYRKFKIGVDSNIKLIKDYCKLIEKEFEKYLGNNKKQKELLENLMNEE